MRRIPRVVNSLLFMLLTCVSGSTFGQDVKNENLPILKAKSKLYEVGVFRQSNIGSPLFFEIENTSESETAMVKQIKVSCGCLSPKLNSPTISPGETVELKVDLDTTRVLNDFHKSIFLFYTTDNSSDSEQMLKVNFKGVAVTPSQLYYPSSITLDLKTSPPASKQTVVFLGSREESLAGFKVLSMPKGIKSTIVSEAQLGLGAHVEFEVDQWPSTNLRSNIEVQFTLNGELTHSYVPILIQVN